MRIIDALTPALTMLLVALIVPWLATVRQKAEKNAIDSKSICYPRSSVIAMRIMSGVVILLTLAVLICTILYTVIPEIMEHSDKDIWGIPLTWVLCVAVDVFTIVFAVIMTRKITYDHNSFTDIRLFRKKQQYFYKDITKIENTVKIVYGMYESRKGKLKIYIGEKCVKIPAMMLGVNEFVKLLHNKCPQLDFD
ncbi:MAG: hypothetical protein J1F33_04315 [Clostridiales bacterium]|nr:hypothetical protein [Clostridiales bacterium]